MRENTGCDELKTCFGKSAALVAFAAACCLISLGGAAFANPGTRLAIGGEADYGFSNFKRSPEPENLSIQGDSLAQDYRLTFESGVLKQGLLNGAWGWSFDDRYGAADMGTENEVLFNYGRRFRLEALGRRDLDEEVIFSPSAEPQSPIRSLTKRYRAQVGLTPYSSVEYELQRGRRNNVLFGSVVDEETKVQRVRFRSEGRLLNAEGEYRRHGLDDLLGIRNRIESKDKSIDIVFKPRQYLSVLSDFEDNGDEDVVNGTALRSREGRLEFMVMPAKTFTIRPQFKLRKDTDTRTNEDVDKKSAQILFHFDPARRVGLGFSYEKEQEDKIEGDSLIPDIPGFFGTKGGLESLINSLTNRRRFTFKLIPFIRLPINGEYSLSDKESSVDSENLREKRLRADIGFEVTKALRLSSSFSVLKQENIVTSLFASDSSAFSFSVSMKPWRDVTSFLRFDRTVTESPVTESSNKINAISSNIQVNPTPFLEATLRTSAQAIEGVLTEPVSKRLLNSLEISLRVSRAMKILAEYEMINGDGSTFSNEHLFDTTVLYNLGKLDFTLRYQKRMNSGGEASDRSTLAGDLKYRFNQHAAWSLRFSLIDFIDPLNSLSSYETQLLESLLKIRF